MLKYRNLGLPGAILAGAAFIVTLPVHGQVHEDGANGGAAAQDSAVYALDLASVLLVHAGKSGLLKGFGHEHQVRAHAFSGTVVYFPDDPGRSRVRVTVLTDGLRVVPEADSADIPEITRTMREKTLRVDSFPVIEFVSREVEVIGAAEAAGAADAAEGKPKAVIRATGDLTMVGVTRPVSLDLTLEISADTLRAEGSFVVKQTDFGIKPYSKVLGLVKVKDEVRFELRVVATTVSAGR
jgi:polyisoprenoid-binding protein YceI